MEQWDSLAPRLLILKLGHLRLGCSALLLRGIAALAWHFALGSKGHGWRPAVKVALYAGSSPTWRPAIQLVPGVLVSPCAMIEQNTTSAARSKIRGAEEICLSRMRIE